MEFISKRPQNEALISVFNPTIEEDEPSGTLGGICKQALGRESKVVYPGETTPDRPAGQSASVSAALTAKRS